MLSLLSRFVVSTAALADFRSLRLELPVSEVSLSWKDARRLLDQAEPRRRPS